ncbi:MAG: NAD-dependent deacylase [Firmicutes bacterium]|nr:NAD-dependent deacylase [Bacillota bacterium]
MEEARRLLRTARRVAVLTGAGVSAESGIPTFRGPGGLWRNFRPEELATPEAFARDPRLVWEWYAWRREVIAAARPNAAHLVLARMEEYYPDFTLITQNIDGLHQAAGSRNVVELHGNIWRVRCLREGKTMEYREVPPARIPPTCSCGALLRPDVVWFGEALPEAELARAFAAARECDLMLVVGTSAVVQPAASLPYVVRRHGGAVIEVNTERTPVSEIATRSFLGPAARVLPELWAGVGGSLPQVP